MKILFLILFNFTAFLTTLHAAQNINLPQPLFLKLGFSSVLEFSETPLSIVVGDTQSFQVEKLNKSLVIRTLVPYASTNLFVYFKNDITHIFTLTASEDAVPTTYKKIEEFKIKETIQKNENNVQDKNSIQDKVFSTNSASTKTIKIKVKKIKEGIFLKKSIFDKSKDYLTIDFKISAGSESVLKPKWDLIRLSCKDKKIIAYKIWSARNEIQKDSSARARLIYLRPDVEITLKSCYIIVPLFGRHDSLKLNLGGSR